MRQRTKCQLERMHVWTHRRFHDAKGKYWRYWLDVRTKIQDLIVQESRRRYILAEVTKDEEAAFPVVPGHCTWCGKPVPRKNQRFCPGIWKEDPWGNRRVYECYNVFFNYWVSIPRFKRVVFLRDDCTCKACGARPTWTNKHGVELPDVGQLACDHIVPLARGGKTELPNLQTLCRKCNGQKRDKLDWKPEGTVSLDEFLELAAAQRVADQGGFVLSWERGPGGVGLIIGMGRSNECPINRRRRAKGNPEHSPSQAGDMA